MKKCKYCNKKNIEDDFCSDYCKNKGEKYFNYWKKYAQFKKIVALSNLIQRIYHNDIHNMLP